MKNHQHTISGWRSGWTLIELIFTLVVVGILASIAIARLASSRDDAELSKDVANMNVCIKDMSGIYTALGTDLDQIDSLGCNSVICYTLDINTTHMVVDFNTSAPSFCDDIENVGGNLAGTHQFAGKGIAR